MSGGRGNELLRIVGSDPPSLEQNATMTTDTFLLHPRTLRLAYRDRDHLLSAAGMTQSSSTPPHRPARQSMSWEVIPCSSARLRPAPQRLKASILRISSFFGTPSFAVLLTSTAAPFFPIVLEYSRRPLKSLKLKRCVTWVCSIEPIADGVESSRRTGFAAWPAPAILISPSPTGERRS